MHIGKSYGLLEFLRWTRRKAYILAAGAVAVTALYQLAGWRWLALPWPVLAMLGTAASFIVGFKNAQTYNRTAEAQQIWSAITASSRYWGLIARDFPASGPAETLLTRHLCWLTAVRYRLRVPRVWEAATRAPNAEYRRKVFGVPELDLPLAGALERYLPPEAIAPLIASGNVTAALIGEQSRDIRALFLTQDIALLQYAEMQKTLKDLLEQYSRAERIKDFPYPRQYAIINSVFVWAFALLLPLGVVSQFAQLDVGGLLHGRMAWLGMPFSVLVAWMYVALDQVGESTENPFEGGANDVPITHLCARIESELRTMFGQRILEPLADPAHPIVL
ncbi:bestrophin family ion channel [Pseudoduganella sp. LjRoot289]|uniref:bestrophin family protein n=1 Tax=Pseudoduganella sp. LjRoot289 TaxID=3342314 RepID=UPI003ECD6F90